MTHIYSKEQISYLRELKNGDYTWAAITTQFNSRFDTDLSKKALQLRWDRYKVKNKEDVESEYTESELRRVIGKQNDTLKAQLQQEKIKTSHIVDACTTSIAKMGFKKIKKPRGIKVKKPDLEMHLLRSDAQVGEVVQPEFTSGLGLYNFEIYKKRVDELRDKVVMFWEQDNKSLGLKKLVSPQLGDHVEGENIYRGQPYYIDLNLVDQVFESLFYEVHNFWTPLAERFSEVELFCVTGNHGRTGAKGEYHIKTNWDYVYYKCLKQTLEMIAPHIKVFISESPKMIVKHGDFLFEYKHGDDTNSWNGIPYYGLDRAMGRTNQMFNQIINYSCLGHFHSPANLNDTSMINGSLVGGSMLSINKMGLTSVPSQKMFYFDKKHGINRESNIYVDKPVQLTPDDNGIFTPIDNKQIIKRK